MNAHRHPKTVFYFNTLEQRNAALDYLNSPNIVYFGSTKKLQEICPENCTVKLVSMMSGTDSMPEFEGYVVVEDVEGEAGPQKLLDVPPLDFKTSYGSFQVSLEWGVDQLTSLEEPEPEVVPNAIPIYTISPDKSFIYIGKDTDALYVAQVSDVIHNIYVDVFENLTEVKRTLYYDLRLHASAKSYPEDAYPFDLGTAVVIWNARGLGRESFLDNFISICRAHKPKIVILTEAEIKMRQLKEVADLGKYRYEHFGYPGNGWVVLLWDKYAVNPLYGLVTEYGLNQLVGIMFEVVYQPPGKRRMLPHKTSRPPDAQDWTDDNPGRWIDDFYGDDPTID